MIGACLAPAPRHRPALADALLAFSLALGIGAHALDELNGRPLGTQIPARVLVALAVVTVAGAAAIGIWAAFAWTLRLLPFVAAGSFLVFAYNLELLRRPLPHRPLVRARVGRVPAAHGLRRPGRDGHGGGAARRRVRDAAQPRAAAALDPGPARPPPRRARDGRARAARREPGADHAATLAAAPEAALKAARGRRRSRWLRPSRPAPRLTSICDGQDEREVRASHVFEFVFAAARADRCRGARGGRAPPARGPRVPRVAVAATGVGAAAAWVAFALSPSWSLAISATGLLACARPRPARGRSRGAQTRTAAVDERLVGGRARRSTRTSSGSWRARERGAGADARARALRVALAARRARAPVRRGAPRDGFASASARPDDAARRHAHRRAAPRRGRGSRPGSRISSVAAGPRWRPACRR